MAGERPVSLINDVLRDLERRGHPEAPRALPPAQRPARPTRRWLWWVLAAALAGVLLHWSLGGDPSRPPANEAPLAETGAGTPPPADEAQPGEPASAVLGMLPRSATAGETGEPEAREDEDPRPAPVPAPEPEPETPAEREPAAESPATAATTARDRGPEPPTTGAEGSGDERAKADRTPDPGAPAAMRRADASQRQTRTDGDGDIVIRRSGDTGTRETGDDGLAAAKRALGRGQRALAISRLANLLDADPDHLDARLLLARLHIEDGRPRAAGELLDAGLDRQPGDPALAFLLGRLLLEQGRLSEARMVLTEHAPPVGTDPDYHLLLALAHRQAGDHDAAISVYRDVTETSPGVGAAWVGLGVSLEAAGDGPGARAAYRRAVGGDDRRAAMFARQRLSVMPASPEAEEH